MAHQTSIQDLQSFSNLLEGLESAIKIKDKNLILHFYDKINCFNLEFIPDELFNKYDALINSGNEVLYS